jgi:hypothetical protein
VCARAGIGRFRNGTYNEFLRTLNSARSLTTKIGPKEVQELACTAEVLPTAMTVYLSMQEKLTGISAYDFNIAALPVTFRHDESSVKYVFGEEIGPVTFGGRHVFWRDYYIVS